MAGAFIDIKAKGGGTFAGYLALPPAGKGPGLVVFQEIFGINEAMRLAARMSLLQVKQWANRA